MLLLFANQGMLRQNVQTVVDTVVPVISPSPTLLPSLVGLTPLFAITLTPLPPDFPTHIAETLTAMPTFTPEATSTLQPQQCTFPLAKTTDAESIPEEYTFSEPQVVLTDRFGADIIGWLPDSQRVLLTQLVSDEAGNNTGKENIELFNPQTGKTQVYATYRSDMGSQPAWVEGLNAVLYTNNVFLKDNRNSGTPTPALEFQHQLGLSWGDSENVYFVENTKLLTDRYPTFSSAIKPDGSQIIYRSGYDKQLTQYDTSSGTLVKSQPIPFDATKWEYEGYTPQIYNMIWRPDTTQLFLSSEGFGGVHGSYSFLFDTKTETVCEIGFGSEWGQKKWATIARWSPNGRYLAIIRVQGFQASSSDLTILDTTTGNLSTMEFYPQDMKGRHYITDIAWAPDNYHLVAIGETTSFPHCAPNCNSYRRLYLVDFISKKAELLFPSYQVGGGQWDTSLAWSPDGSKIMAKCSTETEGRLCLVPVQTGGE
jgi:WD40 repeat protein